MKSYETIIQDDIRDGVIHGAAVLAGYPDHDFCDKGFGFAENTLTYPMNTDTVIDIASVTKATATITALLVCHSRGLIDFDAPFTDYLTDYQPKLSVPVRIRKSISEFSARISRESLFASSLNIAFSLIYDERFIHSWTAFSRIESCFFRRPAAKSSSVPISVRAAMTAPPASRTGIDMAAMFQRFLRRLSA